MLSNLRAKKINLTKYQLSIINRKDKRKFVNKPFKLNKKVGFIINNKKRTLLIETNQV